MSPAKTWAVPLLGVGLLAGVWAVRPGAPAPGAQPAVRPREAAPAPPREVARALESARVRATWENYRNALASGNEGLAAALVPILRRDRQEALRLAEEELGRARTGAERDVARRALEALK